MPRPAIISVFEGAVETIRLIGPFIVTFLPDRSIISFALFAVHPEADSMSINPVIINLVMRIIIAPFYFDICPQPKSQGSTGHGVIVKRLIRFVENIPKSAKSRNVFPDFLVDHRV
jgi:hypothetical protein